MAIYHISLRLGVILFEGHGDIILCMLALWVGTLLVRTIGSPVLRGLCREVESFFLFVLVLVRCGISALEILLYLLLFYIGIPHPGDGLVKVLHINLARACCLSEILCDSKVRIEGALIAVLFIVNLFGSTISHLASGPCHFEKVDLPFILCALCACLLFCVRKVLVIVLAG